MTRLVLIVFFTSLLSCTLCRHLTDTVSDARTFNQSNAVGSEEEPRHAAITGTVSDSLTQDPSQSADTGTTSTDNLNEKTAGEDQGPNSNVGGPDATVLTDGDKHTSDLSEDSTSTDYVKNNSELATLSTSLLSPDARSDADVKDINLGVDVNGENPDTVLPYVKLDNVNSADIDNSPPVTRPELNHMDNNVDQVQKLETSDMGAHPGIAENDNAGIVEDLVVNENAKNIVPHNLASDGSQTMADTSSDPQPTQLAQTTNTAASPSSDDAITKRTINKATTKAVEQIPELKWMNDEPVSKVVTTAAVVEKEAVPNMDTNALIQNTADNINNEAFANLGVAGVMPDNTGLVTNREPDDVDPLDIFVDDITYQRFPEPMSLAMFKEKISGQTFKKLYILESAEKKLFQHVRQIEVTYELEDDDLYAEFLFRFIYSRQCTKIQRFKLGTLARNSELASFEKEVEGDKTERLMFFSERPDDYVFFMSCTDYKTSPYACRESYYVTLDSAHDPPNRFPWLQAARELEQQMNLSFEDPRFIFDFVMMPCARS